MTIEFRKIPHEEFEVEVTKGEITLKAHAIKKSATLLFCKGRLTGPLSRPCDRCADEFCTTLDEPVEVWISDQAVPLHEEGELLNLIEFFDGRADFSMVLTSELEAIKSDYFYCPTCQH